MTTSCAPLDDAIRDETCSVDGLIAYHVLYIAEMLMFLGYVPLSHVQNIVMRIETTTFLGQSPVGV